MYSANPVMFRANPIKFIIYTLLLGIPLLIWFLQCKSCKVEVKNGELLIEKGLLNKDRTELKISNIRTVKMKQSFFQRLFGTGDLEIYTAGDKPEATAKDMPRPNELRGLLKN
jgi:uncharacterized membrane protein YdbT with pleckstrin-like domain